MLANTPGLAMPVQSVCGPYQKSIHNYECLFPHVYLKNQYWNVKITKYLGNQRPGRKWSS